MVRQAEQTLDDVPTVPDHPLPLPHDHKTPGWEAVLVSVNGRLLIGGSRELGQSHLWRNGIVWRGVDERRR